MSALVSAVLVALFILLLYGPRLLDTPRAELRRNAPKAFFGAGVSVAVAMLIAQLIWSSPNPDRLGVGAVTAVTVFVSILTTRRKGRA